MSKQPGKAPSEQHSVLGIKLSASKPKQEIDHMNTDRIETSTNHEVNFDLQDKKSISSLTCTADDTTTQTQSYISSRPKK